MTLYNEDFKMYYGGVYVGQLYAGSLLIGKGISFNTGLGTLIVTDDNEAAVAQFLADFLVGLNVTVETIGTAKVDLGLPYTPDDPVALSITLTVEGPKGLVEGVYKFDESEPDKQRRISLKVYPQIYNVLAFGVSITRFAFDPYVGDPCFMRMQRVDSDQIIDLPGFTRTCSPLTFEANPAEAACLVRAVARNALVDILNATIAVNISLFAIDLSFNYYGVPTFAGRCGQEP